MLLSRSRFIDSNAVQSCNICEHIVDEAVYALCCEELFCSKCICSWLSTHSTCPICKVEMTNESIASPPCFVKIMIANWTALCDYYAPALVGCQSTVTLSQHRQHVEECPHNPSSSATPIRAVGPSSRADDILSASPSKMKGNLGQRIGVHVIKSNMKDGFAELSTGRGKPLTVAALPSPATSSDNCSVRIQNRRDELMRKVQEKVAGGADGARAQQVAGLQRMSKEKQQALFKEAGIIGHSPGSGTLLAIKADLNLPWYQIRKLKCWLREFGVQLESERTARSFIASTIPAYTAKEVPLTKRNGDIVLAAAVYFPNLIDLVTHYLDMYGKHSKLCSHGGVIPTNQVWLKLGGDHGGGTFKFVFQIANHVRPNSLENTIPISVFECHDTFANLSTMLSMYTEQIKDLQTSTRWKGMSFNVFFFGDYEFQAKCYGLSGASGLRPCLYCLCTKKRPWTCQELNDSMMTRC